MPAISDSGDANSVRLHLDPDVPTDHVIITHLFGEIANLLGAEAMGDMDLQLKVRYAGPGNSFTVNAALAL